MIEQGISTPTAFGLMLCPKHSGEYQFMELLLSLIPDFGYFQKVIHIQPYTTIRTKFIHTKIQTHNGSYTYMFLYSIDSHKSYASNEMDPRMEPSLGT